MTVASLQEVILRLGQQLYLPWWFLCPHGTAWGIAEPSQGTLPLETAPF